MMGIDGLILTVVSALLQLQNYTFCLKTCRLRNIVTTMTLSFQCYCKSTVTALYNS